jgi:hypothetical protein
MEPPYPPVLRKGWFEMEDNWRWTGREFSVLLPQDPFIEVAALELNFVLLDEVLAVTGPVTLQGKVNGRALKPQTFSTPGDHLYQAKLPPGIVAAAMLPLFAPCAHARNVALLDRTTGIHHDQAIADL